MLGLHILNAGIGESIVVELPKGGWGVIDCYTHSLTNPDENPTIEFLKHRDVRELEFVAVTHPHDDHFRGLRQLLEAFPTRFFWRFGAFTGRDLRQILKYMRAVAEEEEDVNELDSADELTKAFAIVRSKERRKELRIFEVSDVKPLYPVPVGSDPDFEILSIAPSTLQKNRYEQDLRKCFDEDGTFVNTFPRQRHNEISLALLIRYGAARVVLGGDVEVDGWRETVTLIGPAALSAHAVKVSHHGSTTGYTSDLWSHFSADRKPYAVVTPFRRFELPKREALEHIGRHTAVLLTTCRQATVGEREAFDVVGPGSFVARTLLKAKFKNAQLDLRRNADLGICSLYLDALGNVDSQCAGAACAI